MSRRTTRCRLICRATPLTCTLVQRAGIKASRDRRLGSKAIKSAHPLSLPSRHVPFQFETDGQFEYSGQALFAIGVLGPSGIVPAYSKKYLHRSPDRYHPALGIP